MPLTLVDLLTKVRRIDYLRNSNFYSITQSDASKPILKYAELQRMFALNLNCIQFFFVTVLDPGPEHGVPLQADRDHSDQLRLLLSVLHRPDRSGQIHLHCSSNLNSDFNPTGKHLLGRYLI